MTAPQRNFEAVISLDAVAASWARQEQAAAGSIVRVNHEVAGRLRSGTIWRPKRAPGVRVAVIARPDLRPEYEPLCWPAAITAAAHATTVLRSWWPDRLVGLDGLTGGDINVVPILEPGRLAAVIVVARWDLDDDEVDVDAFARETVRLFDLVATDPPAMLAEHAAQSALLGHRVRATLLPRGDLRGEASDVNASGDLVLRSPTGLAQRVALGQLATLEAI